jgi:hypothetical protein
LPSEMSKKKRGINTPDLSLRATGH